MQKTVQSRIPVLNSSIVLRSEYFGGLVFDRSHPPEMNLDRVRFQVACLCDGAHTVGEIEEQMRSRLEHSAEYVEYLVAGVLRTLKDSRFLYWRDRKLPEPLKIAPLRNEKDDHKNYLSAPINVIWEITDRCNLACKHCFSATRQSAADQLDTDQVKRVIDLLVDQKIFHINFSGGEPLLREDLAEIFRHASQKNVSMDISTNGILVTPETIRLLKESGISSVQVSVDGLEQTHDLLRGMAGAFHRTWETIRLFVKTGLSVAVSTTVNKTNLNEIGSIIDLTVQSGAAVFKTTLFVPIGRGLSNRGELVLERDDVRKLAEIMKRKQQQTRPHLQIDIEGCFPWLLDDGHRPGTREMTFSNIGCAAGNSTIFVASNGTVSPCPFLQQFPAGNLVSDNFNQLWESKRLGMLRNLKAEDLKGKCRTCEYLGSKCFGGCRAAALAYDGDLYGEDPYCWKQS